jgi:hypothetical protein
LKEDIEKIISSYENFLDFSDPEKKDNKVKEKRIYKKHKKEEKDSGSY